LNFSFFILKYYHIKTKWGKTFFIYREGEK
jgi:hypothetical protein